MIQEISVCTKGALMAALWVADDADADSLIHLAGTKCVFYIHKGMSTKYLRAKVRGLKAKEIFSHAQ